MAQEMICDKCNKPVAPSNNALLYDAALSAQCVGQSVYVGTDKYEDRTGQQQEFTVYEEGYSPKLDAVWTDFNVFREGEIIASDPRTSIQNVLAGHTNGRHLMPTDECEGSPSRRRNFEKGEWGKGTKMGNELEEKARRAYQIVLSLSETAS